MTIQEYQIVPAFTNFLSDVRQIIDTARRQAYTAINQSMVQAYWQLGKRIVEEEQNGKVRADYGKQLLKQLSKSLTEEYGKGFSVNQLYYFRQFYITFSEKFPTPCGILTWSHYKRLLSVSNEDARNWYLKEASEQMWSYATLNRNIATMYYERLLMSQHKEPVVQEMKALTQDFDKDKLEFIKNPIVTEFLGIGPAKSYQEKELEKAILDKLESFLLELGKGFSFVERQKLVRTEKKDYFIDLVFYNFKLKCFRLIDLKVGTIAHEDIGQMEMYVNMFDKLVKGEDDNPTLGIVLCSETDADIAKYLLNDTKNIYMSKYLPCLPSKEELRCEIEQQKAIFALQHGNGETGVEL
jgi:predicted nuclease of restriction endonuclease-like (RecB) superfamily